MGTPKTRRCPECGIEVARKSLRGPVPTFCCAQHKVAFNNRQTVRGRTVVSFAQAWRRGRGKAGVPSSAFQAMCEILDTFNGEDRTAGRPPVEEYVASTLFNGTRYADRRNWKIEQQLRDEGHSEAVREAKVLAQPKAFDRQQLEAIQAHFGMANDDTGQQIAAKAAQLLAVFSE
jgi:hypothetical protein